MVRFIIGLVLLLVAAIALVVWRVYKKKDATKDPYAAENATVAGVITLAGAALGILLVLWSAVRVVPANSVGIPTQFGSIGTSMDAGIHLTTPWTSIHHFSTRMQELSMLRAADEGDKAKDDSIEVRGSDSYQMFVDITVRYFIQGESAPSLFRLVGSEDGVKQRLVRPDVRELVRIEFTKYTAEEAYTSKRQQILDDLTVAVRTDLTKYGLRLDSLAIRNVALEDTLAKAIADRAAAREKALQATIEQGRQITEAETAKKVAETAAQTAVIAAKGQADANNVLNASLTPELLQLRRIEALEKANVIYVPDNSNILVGAAAPIK